jgi:hypothetical protein
LVAVGGLVQHRVFTQSLLRSGRLSPFDVGRILIVIYLKLIILIFQYK